MAIFKVNINGLESVDGKPAPEGTNVVNRAGDMQTFETKGAEVSTHSVPDIKQSFEPPPVV